MESRLDDVFERVDGELDDYVDRLLAILRQPSISARGEGVVECAALLHGILSDLGMEVRDLSTSGSPLLLATIGSNRQRPSLLFYGHYDVQPPEPLEQWTSPPFEPEIRHGRIYARGAADNKGQFFCHLMAIDACRKVAGELPVSVAVLLDGEEECGSPNLLEAIRRGRSHLGDPVAVITSDGPYHDSGRPAVICGVRGILYVELRFRGADRDLHSGHFGGIAPSPGWRLVQCLQTLLDERGRVSFPGFMADVRQPDSTTWAALESIPWDGKLVANGLGLETLPAVTGSSFLERVQLLPHCNISGIRCGYGGEGTKTVIPSEAVAKLDIRLVPDQEPSKVLGSLEAHLERAGFEDVEVLAVQSVPPSRTPVDHPVTRLASRAIRKAWGEEPIVMPSLGATLPVHVFTTEMSLPSLLIPYANPDERNHAPDENLMVEAFRRGIRTTAALIHEAGLDRP